MTTLPTHEHTPNIVPAGKTPLSTIRRPARPQAAGGGMSGRDVTRIIRRHLWLILIFLVVFTIASVGGTMLWLEYAPTYTSTVRLNVTPPRTSVYQTDPRIVAAELDILKQSYVNIAKVGSVLTRAIKEDVADDGQRLDRIQKTEFFTGDLEGTISLLQEELSVSAIRDTKLIRISVSGSTPKELPLVVDAVAAALVHKVTQDSKQRRAEQMTSLTVRLEETQSAIAAAQKRIESIQGGSEVPLMRERRAILQMSLQSLTTELIQLGLLKAQASAAYLALEEQQESGTLATSPEVLLALEQDPTYRSLVVSVKNIEIELESLLVKLGPRHRRVRATMARLETVKKKRKEMEVELVNKQIIAMLQQQKSQEIAVTERLTAVRNQYNEQNEALRDLGSKLTKIGVHEAEMERLQDSAARVDEALLQFRIALGNVPIDIAAVGEVPIEPSMPQYIIMVPLGVFLGLVFGFGLAFLIELTDTSIKSPADIASRVDLPLLGMIPHEDDMDEHIEDMRKLMLTNADSLAGEAYRQIRTCLLFSGPANQRRSLMVTSPSPGDGRTAVTLNLGASIAQGGRKVLVVDANFRQPSIKNLFPQASANGLSSALVGQGEWKDNICEVESNLWVMASGPLPPNPAELLGSEQMRTIIAEMTAEFDQVIFDAAPALVVTDPSVLGTQVDGVIVVVRAGASTHGILQRTRDIFLRVGAHVVGAVLNGVRVTAGGYLKRNYSTFYEYRGQQLASAPKHAPTPRPPLPTEPQPLGGSEPASQTDPTDDLDLS